jgi:hypothetical protein
MFPLSPVGLKSKNPPAPPPPDPAPPPPPTTKTLAEVMPVGTLQLQLPTVEKTKVVTPLTLVAVEGLHNGFVVADTPVDAGLVFVPFNARSNTV